MMGGPGFEPSQVRLFVGKNKQRDVRAVTNDPTASSDAQGILLGVP